MNATPDKRMKMRMRMRKMNARKHGNVPYRFKYPIRAVVEIQTHQSGASSDSAAVLKPDLKQKSKQRCSVLLGG